MSTQTHDAAMSRTLPPCRPECSLAVRRRLWQASACQRQPAALGRPGSRKGRPDTQPHPLPGPVLRRVLGRARQLCAGVGPWLSFGGEIELFPSTSLLGLERVN